MAGDEIVAEFESHHGLKMPDWWPQGAALLCSILKARSDASTALANVPRQILETDPTFGLLVHLSERVYEQTVGALCCFAMKNAASAEVAARVALESGANVRYMLRDRRSRVLAWLRAYIQHNEKQIAQWTKLAETLNSTEQQAHRASIERRTRAHRLQKDFLRRGEAEFRSSGPVDDAAKWPSIFHRFVDIDEAVSYRTAYARLSSQVHADAEDTINYIIGTLAGGTHHEKLGEETIAFSSFLIHFAARLYLLALNDLCGAFRIAVPPAVSRGVEQATEEMSTIQVAWHW